MELIGQGAADIFTTDVIAAAIMTATRSNYSWDVEVKKLPDEDTGKTFVLIDKREKEEDTEETAPKHLNQSNSNILDFPTVCETAVDNQPEDNQSINGIWNLMKEARGINESWMKLCQNTDESKKTVLEDENPFVEDENQVCTSMGYHYNIWKI